MDDPLPPNPYKALNVPKDATLATIRSAHRKLVLSCHPDKVQDESAKKIKAEQFHQVQQAYEILSDDKRRQRYDERVKLDELKAEMASDRGPPLSRRATEFEYVPRGGPPPRRETRDNVIFEHIQPRTARYSDEDYPSRYDSRPSRHYDDDYFHPSSTRRTSGRGTEDKRRARDAEDERQRMRRERQEEEYAREQRKKEKARDKRRGTETKSRSKQQSAYVDSASDSEMEDRYYSSRRETPVRPRYEEIPVRSKEDPRKVSKFERGYDDELDYKISAQQEYMNRMRETVEGEPRRPTRSRATSNFDARPPQTPPVESTKRASARRGQGSRQASPVRSSKRDKRSPEIVDPPSTRKPSLATASSDPKGIKKGGFFSSVPRSEPRRSATERYPSEFKQPPMKRSETAPIDRMHRSEPSKPSNLKNMKASSDTESGDSDSETTESLDTPVRPSQRPTMAPKKTSYVVRDEKVVEPPEIFPPRPRDNSPKFHSSSERPSMAPRGSTARTPTLPRSNTFQDESRSPRPAFPRTESARPMPTKSHASARGHHLFGEQIPEEPEYRARRSPEHYSQENSRSSKAYSRRKSEDVDPDAYPHSKFRQHYRHNVERGVGYA
ncbi:hypothetical protein ACLMJK_008746 [Lecanora helva]